MLHKIILFPFYLLSLLPIKVLFFFSDFLAFLLRDILHYRKSVVYTNLARSFPELKYGEIDKIAKKYYQYMTDLLFESLWSMSAKPKDFQKRIQIENPKVLNEIYLKYQKALIVMGHVGNWTLMGNGLLQPVEGKPTEYRKANYMILYKKLKNRWLNKIMEDARSKNYKNTGNGGRIIDSHSIVEYIATHEDESNFYFFIADQSGKKDSRFVMDFLNQKTLLLAGPETIARGFDLPVVYLGMDRYERGKYKIKFTVISEDSRQCKRGYISKSYMSLLEKDIHNNKPCWLWSHKRWKLHPSDIKGKLYEV